MKNKNYGNKNQEYSSGEDLELLNTADYLSVRNTNRPIINLYENQEEVYKLLNTLLKTTYGNSGNSIIPDLYEEFAPENFVINSFNNKGYYLRIPTGAMLLTTNINDPKDSKKYGEKGYLDNDKDYNFSRNNWKNYAFVNKPNINLLERQLASIIDLNLNDDENNIKIDTIELPITYLIYKIDKKTNLPISDEYGSFSFLKDLDERALYLCENKEKANYYVNKNEIFYDERNVSRPDLKSESFKKYFYYDDEINLKNIEDLPENEENVYYLTYRIENAIYSKDRNDHLKKCTGYNLTVTETSVMNSLITSLPNKKEKAYFDIYLGNTFNDVKECTFELSLFKNIEIDKSETITVKIKNGLNEQEVNNKLLSILNTYEGPTKITAIEITSDKKNIGSRIYFEESFVENFDNYTITVKKDESIINDANDNLPINRKTITKAIRQEYYRNIFELVNDFLKKFASKINCSCDLNNYISGETLLKLKPPVTTNINNNYYIYYDIGDLTLKKFNEYYDKTNRLFISENGQEANPDLILLFQVEVYWKGSEFNLKPKISNIKYFIKRLDKRIISSKIAEFNSLSSTARTELNNYLTFNSDNKRTIEITEDSEDIYKKQIRTASPIFRVSTDSSFEEGLSEEYKGSGDDPSDFSDNFYIKDFITGEKTNYHHANKDLGFIIDKNKGILLYNGDTNTENIKPIEILSKNGNINILNNSSENSIISIRNNKDAVNNHIDIKGQTKIRSKQNNQLTLEKLEGNGVSLAFKENKEIGSIKYSTEKDVVHNKVFIDGKEKPIIDNTKENTNINNNFIVNGTTNTINGTTNTINGTDNIFIGDLTVKEIEKENNSEITLDSSGTTISGTTNTIKSGSNSLVINNGNIIEDAATKISLTSNSNNITLDSSGTTISGTTNINKNNSKSIFIGTLPGEKITGSTNTINGKDNTISGTTNTIKSGSNSLVINSSGTTISGTTTSTGLITGQAGLKIIGGSASINGTTINLDGSINASGKTITATNFTGLASNVNVGEASSSINTDRPLTMLASSSNGVLINNTLTKNGNLTFNANTNTLKIGTGKITATEYSGNAATASYWKDPITLTLSGDTSGNVSMKGNTNITLEVTVKDNSHNHTISNITGLQNALDGKQSSGSYVTLNTKQTITADKTFSGTVIIGAAANHKLITRGIAGSDGDGNVGDLYLQYQVNKPVYFGNSGSYTISADGGSYSGTASKANQLHDTSWKEKPDRVWIPDYGESASNPSYLCSWSDSDNKIKAASTSSLRVAYAGEAGKVAYSDITGSSDNKLRHIFFANSSSDNKLAVHNNFEFNPIGNILKLGSAYISVDSSGNIKFSW